MSRPTRNGRHGFANIGRRPWLYGEPNDPSFIAAGGAAFKRDLPDAEIHLLDAGHFALDEKTDEIARLILDFMARPDARKD
jgi:pimeloyl-ACP methyl ester carboxylesterase